VQLGEISKKFGNSTDSPSTKASCSAFGKVLSTIVIFNRSMLLTISLMLAAQRITHQLGAVERQSLSK
jgi:hypothetical protein